MKIIINSQELPKAIDEAIAKDCTYFFISAKKGTIKFFGNTGFIEQIIDVAKKEYDTFNFSMNALQWFKLANFLRKLKHQPVTLELSVIDEYKVEIKVKGAVIEF